MLEQKLKGLEVSVDNTSVPFASSSVVEITDKKHGQNIQIVLRL